MKKSSTFGTMGQGTDFEQLDKVTDETYKTFSTCRGTFN